MPVGTVASVKGVHQRELRQEVKAQIILGNTYHLMLRPGMEVMEQSGGLHRFMNWSGPLLTDSGGYQVFSLAAQRKITEEGVRFRSHIDGSARFLSPESSLEIQRTIGADIVMAFDECPPYPSTRHYVETSMQLTHRWLNRCFDYQATTTPKYGHRQSLFPIVQGGVYPDLRVASAQFASSFSADGYAIGGLSVGEPHADMYEMVDTVCEVLPTTKPRYLMGVGTPENLVECVARGIDMFDCVLPTRNARHGLLYTMQGVINIRNEKWRSDFSAIDSEGWAHVDTAHTKAYLRHLFVADELLGPQIASIHNLAFFLRLMRTCRDQILASTFDEWRAEVIPKLTRKL